MKDFECPHDPEFAKAVNDVFPKAADDYFDKKASKTRADTISSCGIDRESPEGRVKLAVALKLHSEEQ